MKKISRFIVLIVLAGTITDMIPVNATKTTEIGNLREVASVANVIAHMTMEFDLPVEDILGAADYLIDNRPDMNPRAWSQTLQEADYSRYVNMSFVKIAFKSKLYFHPCLTYLFYLFSNSTYV